MSIINTGEQLAAEVKRRVALCTIAQGAETDLAAQVFEGRRKIGPDMIPCVAIIEGTDTARQANGSVNCEVTQHFVVFAYVPCSAADPNIAARAAIRDIKRAIFTTNGRGDYYWGRTVRQVRYMGKDIGPRADGASFVVAAVEFEVDFVENLSKP